MEFFFCESCGKRVTSADLEAGRAKDKQVKGVFCANCAKGVMTVEFAPISTEEATRILKDENPRATPGAGREIIRKQRSTSEHGLPVVKKGNARPPQHSSGPVAPSKGPATGMVVAVAIAALLMLAGLIGIATSSGEPRKTAREPEAAPVPAPALPRETTNAVTPPRVQEAPVELVHNPGEVPPVSSMPPLPETPVDLRPPAEPAKPESPSTTPETPVQPAPVAAPPSVVAQPAPAVAPNNAPVKPPAESEDAAKLLRATSQWLAQDQLDRAVAGIKADQSASQPVRDALAAALEALRAEEQACQQELAAHVGKPVRLSTRKEAVSGTLASVEFPVMKIEKTISINGQPRGTTNVVVRLDELTEASRRSFLPKTFAPTADTHAGRLLRALGQSRLEEATAVLSALEGHALRPLFDAELKLLAARERERLAGESWEKVAKLAEEASSQARAKQALEELNTFATEFAGTEFSKTSLVVSKLPELKARAELAVLAFDPRVPRLFKGRVVSYDAKTAFITLAYDFQTKEQTEDFSQAVWAPPGDHTGLTWKKGSLTLFCKGTNDCLFVLPQFRADGVCVQVKFGATRHSWERLYFVIVLASPSSAGKTPELQFLGSHKDSALAESYNPVKINTSEPVKAETRLELSLQGQMLTAKINGKPALDYKSPHGSDRSGVSFRGGWDSGVTITALQVSGKLDPGWLAAALRTDIKK